MIARMPSRIARLAALYAAAATAGSAAADSLTARALTDWLARYERAWETRNADAAASLFTEHATYRETPFAAPFDGRAAIRDYWTNVTADQRDVDFMADVVSVSDNVGVAHWAATFSQPSTGKQVALDGVFVLAFAADGRCESLREWWHAKE